LAGYSASLAVLVLQQNLAARLLSECQQKLPAQWVATPLFDSPAEWPFQIGQHWQKQQLVLDGCWSSLCALPLAGHVLLPVNAGKSGQLALAYLPVGAERPRALSVHSSVVSLGLNGCPVGDLTIRHLPIPPEHWLQADGLTTSLTTLWSQAEVVVMAIRAGIARSSYTTARDYARQRYQGGKIIIQHSLIQKMLADLYRDVSILDEGWRTLAGALQPLQPLTPGQLGQALVSAEKLPWLTSDGIQLLGGIGYMEDYPQARRFRDAKQCECLLGHPQARHFSLWQAEAV
jgi:alkylation response protein AidB-like acyl-CoA dehydrogenase